MSGRIRPSARKKTLNNVRCSALSITDKKCIEEVFEKFEQQKDEIIGLINGQETLQKALAEKNAEIERLKELVSNANKLKVKAIKEFATQVRGAFYYEFDEIIPSIMADKIDNLVKEMVGDAE